MTFSHKYEQPHVDKQNKPFMITTADPSKSNYLHPVHPRLREWERRNLTYPSLFSLEFDRYEHVSSFSGQTVFASSHPGGARPGKGGRDSPGSSGFTPIEALSALRCLTQAWMLCPTSSHLTESSPNHACPPPITWYQRALFWARTWWTVGPWGLLLPDWNRRQVGEKPLSLFMMSAAA